MRTNCGSDSIYAEDMNVEVEGPARIRTGDRKDKQGRSDDPILIAAK